MIQIIKKKKNRYLVFFSDALQMKDWWKSNINVWFPFMYSQKLNCYSKNRITMFCLPIPTLIQGADDKLGRFLDQDIEASANHRNVLRHSLESCPSLFNLMWTNHEYLQKNVGRIQNLCNSAKSFACRKKSTGDCKISKSAQVPDLPFEESFWTKNQEAG